MDVIETYFLDKSRTLQELIDNIELEIARISVEEQKKMDMNIFM